MGKIMRVSSYLIGSPLKDKSGWILMHGYTGALDRVSAEIGSLLFSCRGQPIETSTLHNSTTSHLQQRGYLTHLSPEEEKDLLIHIASEIREQELLTSRTSLVIVPSHKCNLRCPYCFQPHSHHEGKDSYNTILTESQVHAIFSIISKFKHPGAFSRALGIGNPHNNTTLNKRSGNASPLITLFGGEPLLPETHAVVSLIVQLAQDNGYKVDAITNGTFISLYESLIGPSAISRLQVTLDGSPATHNKRRIGPGYKETFSVIESNIKLALSRGAGVSVRINVDKTNLHDLEYLQDLFCANKWFENPLFHVQAAAVHGGENPTKEDQSLSHAELVNSTTLLKSNRSEISHDATNTIESYENTARDVLKKCMLAKAYPFRSASFCGAEKGMLVFEPLGNVFSCWEDLGQPELKIGSFDSNGLQLDREKALAWLTRFPGAIEVCSRCPYALIHASGCAKEAIRSSGQMNSPSCMSFQEFFPSTLAYQYAELESQLLTRA